MSTPTLLQTPDLGDVLRMLERRIARLERVPGGYASTDVTFIASLAISGLTLSSQTVVPFNDAYSVSLKFSWTAISVDPNAFDKDPVVGYLTSWSLDGTNWSPETQTDQTTATIENFQQGQLVSFRVRAITKNGTKGPYSTSSNTTTADNTAPGQPSTPTVAAYLGQLKVTWNGLSSTAGVMPADFRFVEVHISTTSATFTPSAATLSGTILRGGGDWIITDLPYGTLQYVRLVAVDQVGNRSPSSTAGSGTAELLVNADVGPNAIDTANIVNLAVNNAKIADLSVGKLTAGTLSAVVTISGRIATALTGTRVEMNINGIQAYNSGGTQTVNIDASTGAATVTGRFRTAAASGSPYLDMIDSGDRSTIYLYGLGTDYAFINSPQVASAPSLGLNSGPYLETNLASAQVRQRMWMSHTAGIRLEHYRTSGGALFGGQIVLDWNNTYIRLLDSTAVERASLFLGGNFSKFIQKTNAGVEIANHTLFNDGTQAFQGSFLTDFAGTGGVSALFCGTWNPGAATSFSVSYGVTMSSRPQVIYAVHSAAGLGDHRLSVFNTTGFTVLIQNSNAINLNYWCYRTG